MYNYKCSDSQLARFFRGSRDKWKTRSEKYHAKIRSLQVKLRDLQKSRDHWKDRAKQAEEKHHAIQDEYIYLLFQKQSISIEDDIDATGLEEKSATAKNQDGTDFERIPPNSIMLAPDEAALQIPYGHMFPVCFMQTAIEQVIDSFSSLRGCQKNLEHFFTIPVPSITTIWSWVLRLGLYEIEKPIEWRTDRIYLVDMTVELGKAKCLLVVGIPKANLPILTVSSTGQICDNYALGYHDIDILAIEVVQNPTGEIICQHLKNLSRKIGPPLQIISDHGSDIHKGIRLFTQNHEDTIYTYDITHKMSLLLKYELQDDNRFKCFMEKCATTLLKVQQTELNCIKPPIQRTKARYHNIDTYVKWAENILRYQAEDEFSELGKRFIMDAETFESTWQLHDTQLQMVVSQITWKTYETKEEFIHAITTCAKGRISEQHADLICRFANEGKRYFEKYYGWIIDYKQEILLYAQFMEIINAVEKQVKDQGLNQESKSLFETSMADRVFVPRAQHLKENVADYLSEESGQIPKGQTLLGTTDVLESIIGKYKQFSARSPIREIGKRILAIPLFTVNMASELVKKAMESVRGIDVDNWAKRVIGKSPLAKRKAILGVKKSNKSCMKKNL